MRLLHGLGQTRAVLQLIVPTLEVERLADRRVPEPREDGELLLQPFEALAEGLERHSVGGVLGVVPPGTEAELGPAAAHVVHLRHLDGEQSRQAERRRGHHGAQPDAVGLPGDARQRQPRIGGPGQAVTAHGQEVVGAEKASKPPASAACAIFTCWS